VIEEAAALLALLTFKVRRKGVGAQTFRNSKINGLEVEPLQTSLLGWPLKAKLDVPGISGQASTKLAMKFEETVAP
jgi:hypothetical protein